MRPRSYLYVPGDSDRKLASAGRSAADAIMIDLEDAVAPERKNQARELVRHWLEDEGAGGDREVWVRIALADELESDLRAVVGLGALHGLVLAKTESASDVARVDQLLQEMADDRTVLMPLLESAGAVLRAEEIARAERVDSLQIGEADLRADVGLTPGDDESELLFARSTVVFASIAAGIAAPIGPASTNFTDLPVFRASCERLRRLGFAGRACIHPRQVDVVHEVSAPSTADVEAARTLIAEFDSGIAAGRGVMTGADGQMVDLAVIKQARRLLAEIGEPGN